MTKATSTAMKQAPAMPDSTITEVRDRNGNRLCSRTRVSSLLKIKKPDGEPLIPVKYLEALEHNQKIASCCRHPENHDIEAFKSRPEEAAPDIYIFYCSCGRQHRRFCIGGGDPRPVWSVR